MNKICTTIEQSKKLIELGIDVNTADLIYQPIMDIDSMSNVGFAKIPLCFSFNEIKECNIQYLPAWSLSALLKLMPPYLFEFERGIDLNIYRNLNGKGWHCSYMPNTIENMKNDKFKQITNGDEPVDAAFEMVCWLKENEKI